MSRSLSCRGEIGRALHRARGLKLTLTAHLASPGLGRALHRARGLKSVAFALNNFMVESRPSPGAWIEMPLPIWTDCRVLVAPFTGRVD